MCSLYPPETARQKLDAIARTLVDCWSYIDKVQVRLHKRCRALEHLFPPKFDPDAPASHVPRYRYQLDQPSQEGLLAAAEATAGRKLINYVELALDLVAADPRAAQATQEFLDTHMAKPWPRKAAGVSLFGHDLFLPPPMGWQ